jgi:hypothetical protein
VRQLQSVYENVRFSKVYSDIAVAWKNHKNQTCFFALDPVVYIVRNSTWCKGLYSNCHKLFPDLENLLFARAEHILFAFIFNLPSHCRRRRRRYYSRARVCALLSSWLQHATKSWSLMQKKNVIWAGYDGARVTRVAITNI